MTPAIVSEVRKLLTVRSTYAIFLFCLAILGVFVFYSTGIKASPMGLQDPFYFMQNSNDSLQNLMMLGSLVAVLLMTHEYRYNTIVYTLTAANSRSKVLIAKIVAVSLYSLAFTVLIALSSALLLKLGLLIGGHQLVPQTIYYHDIIWRGLAFGWGTMMMGLLFAVLLRSQVAAIAALFLWPGLVEGLLSLLLHAKVAYLPFNALNTVISGASPLPYVTATKAFFVFLITLAGGWLVAWVLFLRRDAN